MSIINEEQSIPGIIWTHFEKKKTYMGNEYFLGSGCKNIKYKELNLTGKRFILWLISYELNFDYAKIDYYFRNAKNLQMLFDLPGWMLLLPNAQGITKDILKKNLINQAIAFKGEQNKQSITLSSLQAHTLNCAYKKFLWAL